MSGSFTTGDLHFALTHDGNSVVYRADQDVDDVFELHLAPIDASQAPIRLNEPLDPNEDIAAGFRFRGGTRVVYRSDQDPTAALELFSVPTNGSQVSRKHSAPLVPNGNVLSFQLSADGTKVAYSVEYTPPMGAIGKIVDLIFMERLMEQLLGDSLTNLKLRLETSR